MKSRAITNERSIADKKMLIETMVEDEENFFEQTIFNLKTTHSIMKFLTYRGIQIPIRIAKHKKTEAKNSAEVTKCRCSYWLKKFSQKFWGNLGFQLRKKTFPCSICQFHPTSLLWKSRLLRDFQRTKFWEFGNRWLGSWQKS